MSVMPRLLCLLGAVLSLGLTACTPDAAPSGGSAPHAPNIVLILADDMGIGDPGAYNPDSKVPTPHLDRLAAEGIRLTDAHSPSAVCTPTRYGLLTGRYAWRTRLKSGVLWGYSPALIDTARPTLASILKAAGYATAGMGKWHLGLGTADPVDYTQPLRPSPIDYGFDTYFGIPASLDMAPYVYLEDDRAAAPPTDSVAASAHRRQNGGGFWRGGPASPGFRHDEVLPHTITRAVEYIEGRAAAPTRPFFLYVPLSAPHTPWLPVDAFRGVSGAGYYGDFAAQVDAGLGDLLNALDRTRLADDTIVLFTSDNGAHWPTDDIDRYGHQANLGYRGQKADIWEGGHRVPFLARWPGRIPAGAVSDALFSLTDLPATLAALAGATVPDGSAEDSRDQSAILLGRSPETPIRESVVHHSLDGMFAVRKGPWKLIEGLGSGGFTAPRRIEPAPGEPPGQLYNLADDPGETRNLYADYPERVAELTALLEDIRNR